MVSQDVAFLQDLRPTFLYKFHISSERAQCPANFTQYNFIVLIIDEESSSLFNVLQLLIKSFL
jgi:hypothetical protein